MAIDATVHQSIDLGLRLQRRTPGRGLGDAALMVAAVASIDCHTIGFGGGHGHVGGQLLPAGALRGLLQLELHKGYTGCQPLSHVQLMQLYRWEPLT